MALTVTVSRAGRSVALTGGGVTLSDESVWGVGEPTADFLGHLERGGDVFDYFSRQHENALHILNLELQGPPEQMADRLADIAYCMRSGGTLTVSMDDKSASTDIVAATPFEERLYQQRDRTSVRWEVECGPYWTREERTAVLEPLEVTYGASKATTQQVVDGISINFAGTPAGRTWLIFIYQRHVKESPTAAWTSGGSFGGGDGVLSLVRKTDSPAAASLLVYSLSFLEDADPIDDYASFAFATESSRTWGAVAYDSADGYVPVAATAFSAPSGGGTGLNAGSLLGHTLARVAIWSHGGMSSIVVPAEYAYRTGTTLGSGSIRAADRLVSPVVDNPLATWSTTQDNRIGNHILLQPVSVDSLRTTAVGGDVFALGGIRVRSQGGSAWFAAGVLPEATPTFEPVQRYNPSVDEVSTTNAWQTMGLADFLPSEVYRGEYLVAARIAQGQEDPGAHEYRARVVTVAPNGDTSEFHTEPVPSLGNGLHVHEYALGIVPIPAGRTPEVVAGASGWGPTHDLYYRFGSTVVNREMVPAPHRYLRWSQFLNIELQMPLRVDGVTVVIHEVADREPDEAQVELRKDGVTIARSAWMNPSPGERYVAFLTPAVIESPGVYQLWFEFGWPHTPGQQGFSWACNTNVLDPGAQMVLHDGAWNVQAGDAIQYALVGAIGPAFQTQVQIQARWVPEEGGNFSALHRVTLVPTKGGAVRMVRPGGENSGLLVDTMGSRMRQWSVYPYEMDDSGPFEPVEALGMSAQTYADVFRRLPVLWPGGNIVVMAAGHGPLASEAGDINPYAFDLRWRERYRDPFRAMGFGG